MFSLNKNASSNLPLLGVGLRHGHYNDALNTPVNIDFIEIHAENFFAEGGASHDVLADIKQHYAVSLHATSLGLGSSLPAPKKQLQQLADLASYCQPIMISDHACFSWANINNQKVHGGDLLPVPFNEESLQVMVSNVIRAQQALGRTIFVENLSAYLALPGSTYSETEFLVKLCELAGCKLLVDINNIVVNAINHSLVYRDEENIKPMEYATNWLNAIPAEFVGEIHLAGCTTVAQSQLMIDDHAQPVSADVWRLYRHALTLFGAVPTLIEWDENLPSWQELIAESDKARAIAIDVFPINQGMAK
jgi:uncharacterized protein (UPF0276 family)